MSDVRVFVAERFRKAVVLHVIKNFDSSVEVTTPLYLGIAGPSGEGKTFQTATVLRELGAETQRLSGGELESKDAGEPVARLRYAYLKAGEVSHTARAAAVLIDDIDTSIGDWGEKVQYTVNRQILIGELMHLADVPTMVNGNPARRVPILMTGNDFTKLYGPLIRAGRLSSFEWIPTRDERIHAVHGLFPFLSVAAAMRLVAFVEKKRGRTQTTPVPIAFYAHLRSAVLDERIWEDVSKIGAWRVLDRVRSGAGYGASDGVSAEALETAASALLATQTMKNYLSRGTAS